MNRRFLPQQACNKGFQSRHMATDILPPDAVRDDEGFVFELFVRYADMKDMP